MAAQVNFQFVEVNRKISRKPESCSLCCLEGNGQNEKQLKVHQRRPQTASNTSSFPRPSRLRRYPSSQQYNVVVNALLQAHPFLDEDGNGFVSAENSERIRK